MVVMLVAAVLGDAVNYAIGARLGPAVFRRDDVRFLNRRHLERTHEFYERYGPVTIVIARFVPIVRTFAPFVAGVGRMSYGRFAFYNVTGAVLWVVGLHARRLALRQHPDRAPELQPRRARDHRALDPARRRRGLAPAPPRAALALFLSRSALPVRARAGRRGGTGEGAGVSDHAARVRCPAGTGLHPGT